jgi:hypothetical protein
VASRDPSHRKGHGVSRHHLQPGGSQGGNLLWSQEVSNRISEMERPTKSPSILQAQIFEGGVALAPRIVMTTDFGQDRSRLCTVYVSSISGT